jgi:serine/threonine protein kinase
MGALYLCCVGDRGLEKLCVIKTVLPHLADPEYVARFRDEAKVVVKLSHGNLVPVFDAGLVQDELYLAMDYIEGKDLRAVWNRCAKKGIAFPIDVAVYIARELSRGLHYAHNFGGIKLVHRDVSPPNVLVGFSGEVKLTDFGLASSTLKLEKTAAGIIYGKVSYMSPEQARGELIDGRTDIYAAGIILWELLTGRQLFPQNQSDGTELIERVRNPVIDPPSVRAPRVPAALDQIVLRALARNPDERYLTGEQFRAELTAFLASNREYVATDAERVRAFMKDLFDEDIERERRQRDELLETVHEKLQENQRQELAEREAAEQRQQRKADILAAIERKSSDGMPVADVGQLREGEIPGQVMEQLSAYDTAKMLGSIIERWKILRKIGEGGMGRVFEAEHTEIGRRVAIKILHPVYSRTPEVVARFRMEARAASRIGHPNIIEITDSGTTIDGSFYFVMEMLEGIDLAERLKKEQRLPVEDVLTVATQVAQALGAAHQINIVHRDLKPENIFLINRDGNPNFVKVLDFGIAKSLEEEKIRKLTTPGMAMGTPEYMAPEQASGKGSDARSDIYSLGAILYEMLTGRAPIHGENMMDILIRKATEDPVDVALLRPDVPPAVAQLVMRTLSRNPEGRPQSMGELAAELNSHLADIHAGIVTVPKVPPKLPVLPPARGSERPEPGEAEQLRYRRFLLIGGILLSGGLLGVGVILYMLFFPMTTLPPRPADLAATTGPRVPPPPPDAGTAVVVAPVRPDMASSRTVEPPPTQPARDRRNWINGKPPGPPIERSAAFAKIQEGRQQIDSGRSDLGYVQCYAATGNAQTRGPALTCMGEAEFGRGRYSEAVKLGKLALKEKGAGRDTFLLLGKTYVKLKNCKEARPFFLRVLNASSGNPEALAGLDRCPQ